MLKMVVIHSKILCIHVCQRDQLYLLEWDQEDSK